MPEEEYSPLKELILDSKLEVVRALSELCHADRSQLANSLLRIFRFDKKEADLLSTLNRLEVDREDETTTLFRGMYLQLCIAHCSPESNLVKFEVPETLTTYSESTLNFIFQIWGRIGG